jgi:osomolarity two-component system response regulator SSK1
LIVEDNIINLKLLEAFMKRLKVRWQTAMNGKEAVTKWRKGGIHLVLMDIQLPVMNGLDATREIRRLERENGIGIVGVRDHASVEAEGKRGGSEDSVETLTPQGEQDKKDPATADVKKAKEGAANGSSEAEKEAGGGAAQLVSRGKGSRRAVAEEDQLPLEGLFKSPVIIVALTASSLQSDRHEALAAGCNDFLTKVCPVSSCLHHILHVGYLLTHHSPRSPSPSSGSNAKSWNGAACRR